MLIDLHAKTSRSKGVSLSAAEVAEKAKAAGLDAVAFCETLSTSHSSESLEACKKAGIHGFVGVEIPTTTGVVIGFVPEVGPFLLSEEWRQLTEVVTPSVEQVVELFESHNGVVVASRPYDLSIPHAMGDRIFEINGIKGVEVFTSGLKTLQADFALEAAAFLSLPTLAGSAGQNVGDFATLFENEITTQSELVDAIKAGQFWAVHIGATEQKREQRREDRPERNDRDRKGGGGGGRDRRNGKDRGSDRKDSRRRRN